MGKLRIESHSEMQIKENPPPVDTVGTTQFIRSYPVYPFTKKKKTPNTYTDSHDPCELKIWIELHAFLCLSIVMNICN